MKKEENRIQITTKRTENGIFGTVTVYGAVMRYALSPQQKGAYRYRGTISVLGGDGRVLVGSGPQAHGRKLSYDLYTSADTNAALEEYLAGRARDIYQANVRTILAETERSVSKDTITPALAGYLYAERYVRRKYAKCRDDTQQRYRNRIVAHCERLPQVAAAKLDLSSVNKFVDKTAISDSDLRLMYNFWSFLTESGYVAGINPWPLQKTAKKSEAALIAAATTPDEIPRAVQAKIYTLLSGTPSGPNCGVALLLWGGLQPLVNGASLCWRHVIFDFDDPDYVCLVLYLPDSPGYTHIYTAPRFPMLARILHARHAALLEQYGDTAVFSDFPVVSDNKDPSVLIQRDAYTRHLTDTLLRCGMDRDAIKQSRSPGQSAAVNLLTHTYQGLLLRGCGLKMDSLDYRYLTLMPLVGDTNADHYISLSDEDATARLYTILRRVSPPQDPSQRPQIRTTTLPDGQKEVVVLPGSNKSQLVVQLAVSSGAGGDICLECPHGTMPQLVTGTSPEHTKLPGWRRKQKDTQTEDGQLYIPGFDGKE